MARALASILIKGAKIHKPKLNKQTNRKTSAKLYSEKKIIWKYYMKFNSYIPSASNPWGDMIKHRAEEKILQRYV